MITQAAMLKIVILSKDTSKKGFCMTFDGHIKVGMSLALAFVGTSSFWMSTEWEASSILMAGILLFFGNLAPDLLEFKVIPHRTYTHFPWYYALIIAGAYTLGYSDSSIIITLASSWDPVWSLYIISFSIGAIIHILCDWPYYGGIPLFSPRRKVALFGLTFESPANKWLENAFIATSLITLLHFST